MAFSQLNVDPFVQIYDLWARRTPSYETHFEDEVIKVLTDFGKGTNNVSDAKGKILGAGYEALIMAFFIGLYKNRPVPLDENEKIKDLGQPIQFWGNLDSKKNRKSYPRLREYMFVALVARTPDIDWIALDKGQWTTNQVVALLMMTMEEYINYGLSVIKAKLDEDENYFYNDSAFLDIFKELTLPKEEHNPIVSTDIPESLD